MTTSIHRVNHTFWNWLSRANSSSESRRLRVTHLHTYYQKRDLGQHFQSRATSPFTLLSLTLQLLNWCYCLHIASSLSSCGIGLYLERTDLFWLLQMQDRWYDFVQVKCFHAWYWAQRFEQVVWVVNRSSRRLHLLQSGCLVWELVVEIHRSGANYNASIH